MKYQLRNCFGDICELTLDLNKVKFIFREKVSGDETYIVVFNNNKVKIYDSDRHGRFENYYDDLEMIYPEQISLNTDCIEPDVEENFIYKRRNYENN